MKTSDFQKQLEQNAEYKEMKKRQEDERQKRIVEMKEIETPFIEYLHQKGYTQINTIGELTKSKDNTELQDIILEWLPKISNKQNSQEVLVRALAVTKKPFDGKILLELFDSSDSSDNLKWAIGNTIACASLKNISEWLEDKLTDNDQPIENQMLVYAAIKYFDQKKSILFLKKLFDKHTLQAIDALTYIGNEDDIDFLLEKRKVANKVQQSAIDKAIKKLNKKNPDVCRVPKKKIEKG